MLHTVHALILQAKTAHLTPARLLLYQYVLLNMSHVTLKRACIKTKMLIWNYLWMIQLRGLRKENHFIAYTITSASTTLELASHLSAQAAELYALLSTCILAKGHNLY